jgi:hypothetical protein
MESEIIIKLLINLLIYGAKALINMKTEARQKLHSLYLELRTNKILLENSGLLNTKNIKITDEASVSLIQNLNNTEITPLFKFNSRGIIFPNSNWAVKRRKTQYAINYIVSTIKNLKALSNQKTTSNARAVRLSIHLRTLHKHLAEMERVLLPVKNS